MSAKNTLNKIASLLNVDLAEETQVIALETMKLENGTTIEAEKFEKGEPVFIMTEDNEKVALPVGKYELENGMILVVAEEGVIGDMMKEEPKEEEEEVEASAEEVSEEVSEEVEMAEEEEMAYATKEELGKAMDELKTMIEEVKSMVEPKKKEDMSAEESVSEEVVEEVQQELSVQEPAAKPIKANPEAEVTKDKSFKFSQGRKASTLDRVLSKMAERKI